MEINKNLVKLGMAAVTAACISLGPLIGLGLSTEAFAKVEIKDDGSTTTENIEAEPEIKPAVTPRARRESSAPARETRVTRDDSEKEAQKYFKKPSATARGSSALGSEDHYLALHIGGFINSDSYSWGANAHNSGVGRINAGVTYRMSSLGSLADWLVRADLIGYGLPEGNALQLALLPMIMFPDSGSKFPLYFGGGAGPGIFFNQVSGSSSLALNIQLVAGARVFDVLENTGFFIETGLKNHILLLSQGQFNGFFLSGGAIFTF